jgi:hypothetical protein
MIKTLFFVLFQIILLLTIHESLLGQKLETKERIDSIFLNSGGESTSIMTFLSKDGCNKTGKLAQIDITQNRAKLLIYGGISPIIYANQIAFETKYNISYFDFGDTGPSLECARSYNFEIFRYLTEKSGNSWMKEIRKDVVGFDDWKRSINKKRTK